MTVLGPQVRVYETHCPGERCVKGWLATGAFGHSRLPMYASDTLRVSRCSSLRESPTAEMRSWINCLCGSPPPHSLKFLKMSTPGVSGCEPLEEEKEDAMGRGWATLATRAFRKPVNSRKFCRPCDHPFLCFEHCKPQSQIAPPPHTPHHGESHQPIAPRADHHRIPPAPSTQWYHRTPLPKRTAAANLLTFRNCCR